MARYSKQKRASEQTQAEALAVARSTQKPGQSKEQTKLIAQGIEKGIELYKKQQKAKARALDKRLKTAPAPTISDSTTPDSATPDSTTPTPPADSVSPAPAKTPPSARLPWLLLILSWLLFAVYLLIQHGDGLR